MIQRQESTPEAPKANADAEALRASLLDVQAGAAELVMSLDMERATGGAEYADEGGLYQSSLRELARRVEEVRAEVQASGDADLQALLTAVQDELVQGYQRLAITHADKTLQAWSRLPDEEDRRKKDQRRRWGKEAGDSTGDWCGIFVNAQLRASGMHPRFAAAFNHTDNVRQFFTYADHRRTPNTITPAGSTTAMELRAYHAQRGSLRSWSEGAAVGEDLRPGDVIIVDWGGDEDAEANHTNIVASYTPASGGQGAKVVTIDGNAFGVRKPGSAMPVFDGGDMTRLNGEEGTEGNNFRDVSISEWAAEEGATEATAEAAAPDAEQLGPSFRRVGSDRGETLLTIVGRGRPSVVDFEQEHQYDERLSIAEPPAIDAPLQRAELGEAKTANPSRAFAEAASGGFGQIPYREEMESRFGADFSAVQSFVGRGLDDLGALAATRGEQVVFSAGTPDRQTVAHELTHVLQSRQGLTSGGKELSDPGDASEREARGVAASLDAPAPAMAPAMALATAGKAAVAAAPSGAIHRQEVAPPPAHLENTQGPARPINWDAPSHTSLEDPTIWEGFGDPTSAREIYNYYLLENLKRELPGELAAYTAEAAGPELPASTFTSDEGRVLRAAAVDALLPFLQRRMSALLAEGAEGHALAEAIRVPLFRASQQALVSTLNVEQSGRYQPERDKAGNATKTFCNVFAYDMVTAMGAYLPRVWWRDPAKAQANPALDPELNTYQLNANALYQWMLEWGGAFGWRSVETPQAAQAEANGGKIVIILAGRGDPGTEDPGHVSVVMAESAALNKHQRTDYESLSLPLQAQAGAANYSDSSGVTDEQDYAADTATSEWWNTFATKDLPPEDPAAPRNVDRSAWSEYASGHGFFVYDGGGHGEVAIRTPEETGLVLPEAAAPAEAAEATASAP